MEELDTVEGRASIWRGRVDSDVIVPTAGRLCSCSADQQYRLVRGQVGSNIFSVKHPHVFGFRLFLFLFKKKKGSDVSFDF